MGGYCGCADLSLTFFIMVLWACHLYYRVRTCHTQQFSQSEDFPAHCVSLVIMPIRSAPHSSRVVHFRPGLFPRPSFHFSRGSGFRDYLVLELWASEVWHYLEISPKQPEFKVTGYWYGFNSIYSQRLMNIFTTVGPIAMISSTCVHRY